MYTRSGRGGYHGPTFREMARARRDAGEKFGTTGPASDVRTLDRNSAEFAEIAARYEQKGTEQMTDAPKYPDSGILSRNERREKDTHAEFRGQGDLTCPHCRKGIAFWIDSWVKARQSDGGKFFSLRFRVKDQQQPGATSSPPARAAEPIDDSIPF